MAARKKSTGQKSQAEQSEPGSDEPMPEGTGADEDEEDTEDDDGMQNTPPEGFIRRNANDDSAGWVAKVKGNVVYGQILGRFTRSDSGAMASDDSTSDRVRHFYQVKLLQPCLLSVKEEDRTEDNETRDAKKGDIVNVDENKGIEGLSDAVKEGGFQFCWILYKGKKAQQKNRGRKFWNIDCRTQKRNAPF